MASNSDSQVIRNYDDVFSRLCHFAALNASNAPDAAMDHLVEQVLFLSGPAETKRPDQVREETTTLFSLDFSLSEIEASLARLADSGKITAGRGAYRLSPTRAVEINNDLENSKKLENEVRDQWQRELKTRYQTLRAKDFDILWRTLQKYLGAVFKRHGAQTIQLFESRRRWPDLVQRSLSRILQKALSETPRNLVNVAREELPAFLAPATPERIEYLVELLDRSFTFFALTLEERTSSVLKAQMPTLTLLLDTNFLFGLLDLHSGTFVGVSKELVQLVNSNKLSVKLYYTSLTRDELTRTLDAVRRNLRGRKWKTALSRAALTCSDLSGIELRYHEMNAVSPLDVDTFFGKYQNFSILLKERGIRVYNANMKDVAQQAISAGDHAKYEQLLHDRFPEKRKSPEAISHDIQVRRLAMSLRGRASNLFEAAAFFVTCDFTLIVFDHSEGLSDQIDTCIFPNQLLQALRPFVPRTSDFDRRFVEAFQMPEFRAVGSQKSRVSSKILSHLNQYEELAQETATALLANNVLRDKLHRVKEESKEFAEAIDNALAQENVRLKAGQKRLARDKEALANGKARIEKQSSRDSLMHQEQQSKLHRKIGELQEELRVSQIRQECVEETAKKHQLVGDVAKAQVENLEARFTRLTRIQAWVAGIIVAVVLSSVWLAVPRMLPWDWLMNNPCCTRASVFGEMLILDLSLLIPLRRCWKTIVVTAVPIAVAFVAYAF